VPPAALAPGTRAATLSAAARPIPTAQRPLVTLSTTTSAIKTPSQVSLQAPAKSVLLPQVVALPGKATTTQAAANQGQEATFQAAAIPTSLPTPTVAAGVVSVAALTRASAMASSLVAEAAGQAAQLMRAVDDQVRGLNGGTVGGRKGGLCSMRAQRSTARGQLGSLLQGKGRASWLQPGRCASACRLPQLTLPRRLPFGTNLPPGQVQQTLSNENMTAVAPDAANAATASAPPPAGPATGLVDLDSQWQQTSRSGSAANDPDGGLYPVDATIYDYHDPAPAASPGPSASAGVSGNGAMSTAQPPPPAPLASAAPQKPQAASAAPVLPAAQAAPAPDVLSSDPKTLISQNSVAPSTARPLLTSPPAATLTTTPTAFDLAAQLRARIDSTAATATGAPEPAPAATGGLSHSDAP
jgi:hypothetical protein